MTAAKRTKQQPTEQPTQWGELYTDEDGNLAKWFPVHSAQADILKSSARFSLALAGSGGGKCFGIDTPILMHDGSVKRVQDVVVGDLLMGNDSTPRRVQSIARGRGELFRVSQHGKRAKNYVEPFDGSYIVNDCHVLSVVYKNKVHNLTVAEWFARSNKFRNNAKGYRAGVEYPSQPLRIDPYFLGAWLGDGNSANAAITTVDPEILDAINTEAEQRGLKVRRDTITYYLTQPYNAAPGKDDVLAYSMAFPSGEPHRPRNEAGAFKPHWANSKQTISTVIRQQTGVTTSPASVHRKIARVRKWLRNGNDLTNSEHIGDHRFANSLMADLRAYHLIHNKHIPPVYLANDRESRLQLLAGLLDTDGYYGHGYQFTNKSKRLACDVVRLARSLGFAANLTVGWKQAQTGDKRLYYSVNINGEIDSIPVRITRKKAKPRRMNKDPLRYQIDVEPIGEGNYYGFELDGNRLFLLADYTVVHNTACGALWLFNEIAKNPKGKYLIVAPNYKTVWAATLPAWKATVEGTDLQGDYQQAHSEYRMPQGGIVYIRSADTANSLEGIQGSAAWIDEGGQIDVDCWRAVQRRVGHAGGRILITSTPYTHNWLYTDFYSRWKQGDPLYYVRQWGSNANPSYSVEEFERAKRELPPHVFSMFNLGVWQRPVGLVYPNLADCVVDAPLPFPSGRMVGSVDWGYSDPFAALAGVLDDTGTLWIVYERYQRKVGIEDHARALPAGVSWYCDRSRPESIRTFRKMGLAIRRTDANRRLIDQGVEIVSRWIHSGRLKLIKGATPSLLEEAELYRYDEDGAIEQHGHHNLDHALDCLRMLCCSLERRSKTTEDE